MEAENLTAELLAGILIWYVAADATAELPSIDEILASTSPFTSKSTVLTLPVKLLSIFAKPPRF